MNTKPIVVIKCITSAYANENNSGVIKELNYILGERMPDYHVFVIPQEDIETYHDVLEFQVFYEKDQQPIYYEELKQLISDSIKQQNHERT